MALSAGTRLGPYEILAPLGAGGMGEVYRALDHRLGREVAIKTLPDAVVTDPERRARFEREARALAALTHAGIAALYEIGETDGRPFLVMELVEGETVAERLVGGVPPLPEAMSLASQLAEGLAAAHARGVVHRDLKPANLKITPEGKLKVLDFGLAKTGATGSSGTGEHSHSPTAAIGLTSSGMLLGTAGYMSPEQVRGEIVDARADVWAFGCILYELLTGFRAFLGGSPWEVLAAVMNDEPDWSRLPRDLPQEVRELLRACLEKDPARRLGDLTQARLVVGGSASGGAITATWRPPPKRWGWVRSRTGLLAGGLLVVIGAAAASSWHAHQRDARLSAAIPSIAILPFRDLGSGGRDRQWLGEGLAAAVSAQLLEVDGMRVFPAWTTLEAVQKGADPMRVAKALGANLVLSGSVQSAGSELRVIYTLLQAPAGSQLAGGIVTAPEGSLFAVQDDLAQQVLGALDLARPQGAPDDGGLPRPAQQDHYLQALGLLQRYDQSASIDQAVKLLEGLAKEAPESPLVHAALGRAFLHRLTMTRDPSGAALARAYCERARQLAPRRPEVEVTLAQLAIRTGEADRAIPLLRHALAVQPGNSEALLALAQAWDGAGDPVRAEEAYQRLIALQPGYWAAYNKLGGFYFRLGKFREAASMFRRVTELNADSARGFSNLSGALTAMGDFEAALQAARRSVALEATGSGVANLGTLQFYLGQYDQAVGSFRKAAELMPSSFDVWMNLGDAYRWTPGRTVEAQSIYRKAIELAREQLAVNPSDGTLRTRLAIVLAKSGDLRAAERELSLVKEETIGPEVIYAAALVATLGSRPADAVALLRRAIAAGYDRNMLARDPEFAGLRREREFLLLFGDTRRAA
ncbi:MAG TPA: protein kinase [Thermoanaerobaculia bacterium]|nr:protein kinase [Thermoanaerobaculia bacterium]